MNPLKQIIILFILFFSNLLLGYTTLTNPPSTWSPDSIPVKWELSSTGCSDVGIEETEAALKASFQTWEDVDCAFISFEYLGRREFNSVTKDGKNRVTWLRNSWPYSSSAIGVTSTWFSGEKIIEADIEFNEVDYNWSTDGNTSDGSVDLQSIATHEIGHLIGLDHTTDPSAVMFPTYSGGTSQRYLSEDDIRGVCFLYPSQTTGCETTEDCPWGFECIAGDCVPKNIGNGELCSPCIPPGNCGSTLDRCLSYPEGGFFCGKHCNSDSDCSNIKGCEDRDCICMKFMDGSPSQCVPSNLSCGTYLSCETDTNCPPGYRCSTNRECIPDVEGEGEIGDSCTSRNDCKTGLCFQGVCTKQCNWLLPHSSCPEGYYCASIECGLGVCLKGEKGRKKLGEVCTKNEECESLYCMAQAPPAQCSLPCYPNSFDICPQNWRCIPIGGTKCGICVCQIGELGDECSKNSDCSTGLCVTKGGVKKCSSYCETVNDCPNGFDCIKADYDTNICWTRKKSIGEGCEEDLDCMDLLYCISSEGSKYCSRNCNNDCNCPIGYSCGTSDDGRRFCIKKEENKEDGRGCGCRIIMSGASNLRYHFWLLVTILFVLILRGARSKGNLTLFLFLFSLFTVKNCTHEKVKKLNITFCNIGDLSFADSIKITLTYNSTLLANYEINDLVEFKSSPSITFYYQPEWEDTIENSDDLILHLTLYYKSSIILKESFGISWSKDELNLTIPLYESCSISQTKECEEDSDCRAIDPGFICEANRCMPPEGIGYKFCENSSQKPYCYDVEETFPYLTEYCSNSREIYCCEHPIILNENYISPLCKQ